MDILKHIREYELEGFTLPIPDTYGVGFEFEHDKDKYITRAQFCYHKKFAKFRCINFNITSWAGISAGAKHYYGKISVRIENFVVGSENTISSGYTDKFRPEEAKDIEFDLIRPVTQEEIDSVDAWDDRWEAYRVGDATTCFDTQEELIELGKQLVKKIFVGKWALEINTIDRRRNDVIKLSDL